jgi:polysaccharide deacetylase family protein (PEP-CTERM system associated)
MKTVSGTSTAASAISSCRVKRTKKSEGMHSGPRKLNAFTVDLEEWYQGIEIPVCDWSRFESRISDATEVLLSLLAEFGARATFFVLGYNVPRIKPLLRTIASAGHEVGTHGLCHTFIYRQDRATFHEELLRAKAETEDAVQRPVVSHRAPYFSITRDSIWALEVLAELGMRYDSSIFPVQNYRYGIPGSPRDLYFISLPDGKSLCEFPVSTVKSCGRVWPCSGGAYFRIYPYLFTKRNIEALNRQGIPANFYIHPWELDPDHPRIPLPKRISLTHYFRLGSTVPRLKLLLKEFQFGTLEEVIEHERPRLRHQTVL